MTDDEFEGFKAYQAECLERAIERMGMLKPLPWLIPALEANQPKFEQSLQDAVDFALWRLEFE